MTKEEKVSYILQEIEDPVKLRLLLKVIIAQNLPQVSEEKLDILIGVLSGQANKN